MVRATWPPHRLPSLILAPVLLILGLAACNRSTPPTVSHPAHSAVLDHPTMVDRLREAGFTVTPSGEVQQPFLSAPGFVLRISGGAIDGTAEVQSFEYPDADAAQADADKVGPGIEPPGVLHIGWLAPPHFFHAGRLVVLYVGEDQAVIDALTAILGPPFAEGDEGHEEAGEPNEPAL